ncbi:MAG TPA: hypothetical protein VFB06_13120 [Streptosporangiaceae bacterium]|nr:hypothetical protein [Streptosporangiaceae bacterium]
MATELCIKRLTWPAATIASAICLFIAYLAQSTAGAPVNSDGASNALQAWDMLHGNLLLHGWTMSDVSFYTTELPEYMLVETFRGLGPDVVHIAGALTYTLLVLLAAGLARGNARGAQGITRALIAAGIMLAPQLGSATHLLLLSPDHVGTGVPVLAAWLIADRGANSRWAPAATGLLLAWTAVADPITEIVAALPLAAVCAGRAYRMVVSKREPLAACRYELSLAVAAVLSWPAAALATWLIAANGGWTISPVRATFAESSAWLHNVTLTAQGLLQLFGADFTSLPVSHLALFAVFHLIGIGLVSWALCRTVRRFAAADLLAQVLTVAIAVNLAAYMFTVQAQNISTTREIAAVLPFGAVLAGRQLAGPLLAARLAPVMAGALAVYGGMLASNAVQPPLPAPAADLTVWLAEHDLTQGLAGYWQASSLTLDSRDTVQVRAVAANRGVLASQDYWEASRAWYDPAKHYADFIVSMGAARNWSDQTLVRQMEARAGRPAHVYRFGPYTIAVWHRNLLARLR